MEIDPRQYESIKVNDDDSHNIILSYLIHCGFKDTVESLVASTTGLKVSDAQMEDMEKRKRILHIALKGNALDAIALTEQVSPDILENSKDLHFALLSLHFIELICSRKCTEALEFARAKLTPFGKVQKYFWRLKDVMALLAYEEPEKSPMFYLVSFEYRQQIADGLNRALLAHANLPSYSALERLIQQTFVVRLCLHLEKQKNKNLKRQSHRRRVTRIPMEVREADEEEEREFNHQEATQAYPNRPPEYQNWDSFQRSMYDYWQYLEEKHRQLWEEHRQLREEHRQFNEESRQFEDDMNRRLKKMEGDAAAFYHRYQHNVFDWAEQHRHYQDYMQARHPYWWPGEYRARGGQSSSSSQPNPEVDSPFEMTSLARGLNDSICSPDPPR